MLPLCVPSFVYVCVLARTRVCVNVFNRLKNYSDENVIKLILTHKSGLTILNYKSILFWFMNVINVYFINTCVIKHIRIVQMSKAWILQCSVNFKTRCP
jgi:hypothetical protein